VTATLSDPCCGGDRLLHDLRQTVRSSAAPRRSRSTASCIWRRSSWRRCTGASAQVLIIPRHRPREGSHAADAGARGRLGDDLVIGRVEFGDQSDERCVVTAPGIHELAAHACRGQVLVPTTGRRRVCGVRACRSGGPAGLPTASGGGRGVPAARNPRRSDQQLGPAPATRPAQGRGRALAGVPGREPGLSAWHYETGDPNVDRETEQLRRQRAELESANRDLAEQTTDLARRLVTVAGFSVREAAALLSVSPARIDQMVQQPRKRRRQAA
jgi:hypothetical protein